MAVFQRDGVAVVIESQSGLVDTLCDVLQSFGYHCVAASTHAEATRLAASFEQIHLLAACVPAPDESRAGIYLEKAARKSPHMAVVLMLNDPLEVAEGSPKHAVRIVKPFSRDEFVDAVIASEKVAKNTR